MQHQLSKGKLLNEQGELDEKGYAFSLVKDYSRKDIKASKFRIKEWDYYYIGNKEKAICLTVADNSYMWLTTISILDFKNKSEITKSKMGFFSMGKIKMPEQSYIGDVTFKRKGLSFSFSTENGKRHLVAYQKNFENNQDFRCDVYLEETNRDSMVIATPFNKKHHFYYNQKINLLKASGYAKLGEEMIDLNKDSYGVLDWGRGVWTYKNTWYWSSLNAVSENGERIGFNLGYGFGDTSAASENMVFYHDKAYKLDDIVFDIPFGKDGKDDYLGKWHFRDKKSNVDLTFTPILDRYAKTDVLVIKTVQHQVFGYFSGVIKVEGEEIVLDKLLGFAEKVYMKY